MLEELFYIHKKTVEHTPLSFKRYLFSQIAWDSSGICIIGARGVGKTTMLLQYYREKYNDVEKCLYISADNVEVCALGLFNTAKEYFKYGGMALIIDEIHKYPSWQQELKNSIDVFKDKKFFISGSSSLALQEGKIDLSRRLVYYPLKGLSFREYLEYKEKIKVKSYTIEEIVSRHVNIAQEVSASTPILKYFKEYLFSGYYPFFKESSETYLSRLLNIIEKILYEDVAVLGNIKKSNIVPLKKILWLIASSVPFSLNIEKMSRDLGISKEYVYAYLSYLEHAGLVQSLHNDAIGFKLTRKPQKIYMENTNLLYAINNQLTQDAQQGAVRETFFVNQLKGIDRIALNDRGDFKVNKNYVFELGGKNKKDRQVKGIKNAYIVADTIEIGQGNKIPLYLFGFLY